MAAPTAPSAITLVDREGKPQAFAPEEAQKAFQSGDWGAPNGQPIPVLTSGGDIVQVPPDQLHQTLASGARIVGHDIYENSELQRLYGDLGSQAENAATQAVSGLTLGGSDAVIGALASPETREAIRKRAEANPVGSTLAKVGGMAVGALATGGLGEAAGAGEALAGAEEAGEGLSALGQARQVLGAPTALLGKVGDLAEQGVARLLPEGAESLAAKVASKGIAAAARGAAEGGALGGADYLSRQALSQDQSVDGEKLLSAIGHGSLLGGLTGGALGGGTELGQAALEAAAPGFRRLAGATDTLLAHHIGIEPEELSTLKSAGLVSGTDTLATLAPKVRAAQEATSARLEELTSRLDTATQEAGSKLPGVELEGLDTAWRKVAKALPEDSPLQEVGKVLAPEPIPEMSQVQFLKTPEGQSRLSELLSSAATNDERNQILTKLSRTDPVPGLMPSAGKASLSFADATQARSAIDQAVGATTDKAIAKGLGKLRSDLSDRIADATESAKRALGKDHEWTQAYDQASQLQEHLASASEALARAKPEESSGFGWGLAAAHAAANGFSPTALVPLAAGIARRTIKARAPFAASSIMDSLAAQGAIQRTAQAVDDRITSSVSSAIGGRTAKVARMGHGFDTVAEKIDAVREAASNMPAHLARVQQAVAGFLPHVPVTAQSFVSTATRSINYLAAALPQQSVNPLMPHVKPEPASDYANAQFSRTFDAVHDPVGVLDDVGRGLVTPEQVAAVAATHPQLKAQMDKQLLAAMREETEPLDLARAASLSLWLGEPVDSALSPANVAASQANFGAPPKSPPGSPPDKGRPKAADLSTAKMTSLRSTVEA